MKELGNRCVRFRSRERKGVEMRKTGIELPAGDLAPRARFVPYSAGKGYLQWRLCWGRIES